MKKEKQKSTLVRPQNTKKGGYNKSGNPKPPPNKKIFKAGAELSGIVK